MIVIGFLNPKGGCGKTTLATNLAKALYLDGYSVLAVDSDPQGTLRDWYGAQDEDADGPDMAALDAKAIARGLKRIGNGYDIVLIDGAAKLEVKDSVNLVKACDVVLIPVQPTPADIWGASDLVEIIQARQAITDGFPLAAFVISRQIVGTKLAEGIAGVLEEFDVPVFRSRTSQRVIYAESMIHGSSVVDNEPRGKAAGEIRAITNELLELLNGEERI